MFTLKLGDFDTNALNVLSLTYVIGPHLNMNKLATHFTHINMHYLIKHSCCDNKIVLSHLCKRFHVNVFFALLNRQSGYLIRLHFTHTQLSISFHFECIIQLLISFHVVWFKQHVIRQWLHAFKNPYTCNSYKRIKYSNTNSFV